MPRKKSTSLVKIDTAVDRIEQSVKQAEVVAQRLDAFKTDGWYNTLVGLGKAFDKSNKTFFGEFYFMDRNQLSRMYVGDGVGRRIIDIVADWTF